MVYNLITMSKDQQNNNNIKFVQDSVCRLCVQESKHLIDIFNVNKLKPELISKYIQHYFDVDIKQDDPHSRFICRPCWCLLDLIIKKRNKFKENDNKLRDMPVEEKLALPHIKEHPGLLVSESVKQIFAENACIKLPAKYWLMNFDVQVDLSTSKLSMDFANKSSGCGNDNTLVQMFCNETEKIELTNKTKMKRKRASYSEVEPSRRESKVQILNAESFNNRSVGSSSDHDLKTK